MKQVTIYYRDDSDYGREEYMAGPYPASKAKSVQQMLALMGCRDFRVERERKAA